MYKGLTLVCKKGDIPPPSAKIEHVTKQTFVALALLLPSLVQG